MNIFKNSYFIVAVVLFFPAFLFSQLKLELEWTAENHTNAFGTNYFGEVPKVIADGVGGVYYIGSIYHPGPLSGIITAHYDEFGEAI